MDGKLYVFGTDKIMVYKAKENTWDDLGMHLGLYIDRNTCVIDNTIYCCDTSGKLKRYDFEGRCWRALKGLKGLPILSDRLTYVKLVVNYGGKMAVLWQKRVPTEEISLERRNRQEVYGKVEWCDVVLAAPKSYLLKFSVAVDL